MNGAGAIDVVVKPPQRADQQPPRSPRVGSDTHDDRRVVSRPTRLPGLDLLRGVAIALVMLRHGWPDTFGGAGIVGVAMFFTLSGYLITGVLVSQHRRDGRINYRRFYRNRILRLYPALLVMLAAVITRHALQGLTGERVVRSALVAGFYVSNIPSLTEGMIGELGHVWTLATEEQFYLVWPLLLAFALRRGTARRMIVAVAVAAVAVSGLMSLRHMPDPRQLYVLPSSWAITLVIGAAAFVFRDRLKWVGSHLAPPLLAAVVLAALCRPPLKAHLLTYSLGVLAVGVGSAVLVLVAARAKSCPRVLQPVRWLGLVSYAAYLWNFPIQSWFNSRGWGATGSVLTIGLTVVMATVSWFALEKPIASWRHRHDARNGVTGSAQLLLTTHEPSTTPVSG